MSLFAAIEKVGRLSPLSLPELRYLTAAADRVHERWPDVHVSGNEQEREALAQKLRERVEGNDWRHTRLSFVVTAASAVFDPERRERPDLASTREFLYAEMGASTSESFLSGLLRAYLDSYVPEAAHTIALAAALGDARPRMSPAGRLLLDAVPEILDPRSGPDQLAARMSEMSDPYMELVRLGVRNPHGTGFMDFAHLSLTARIRPHLSEQNLIEWYIRWLRPLGKEEARNTGAEPAIEALVHPWMDTTPDEKLRSYLVETLIELYGDPRIKAAGVWAGIGQSYLAIVHRWLTREDMRFFTGVVDAVQKDDMWIKRRDFWLTLYDEDKIDAAWAALSSEGFEYARDHLMRQDAKNAYTRVGFQKARQNTSLLIMKIGNKIMVDGCHSYRTHVFDASDPMAPKLFEEGYDCQEIMYASDERRPVAAKSHSNIESWQRWVRDMINADVARSQQVRPYTKVYRPRPPKAKYAIPSRTSSPAYSGRSRSGGGSAPLSGHRDIFGSTGSKRSYSNTGPSNSSRRDGLPYTNAAASEDMQAKAQDPVKSNNFERVSLKKTRFSSLTDRMLAYGPEAAAAILAYLEAPSDGRSRPLLSPKSREGLAWVRSVQGDPPLRLRNALEYLLINLKTSGVDLDDLFAMPSPSSTVPEQLVKNAPASEEFVMSDTQKFPPLPDLAEGRINLLRKHVDALEDLGMWQGTFEQRKVLMMAVRKLKERTSDLRPAEIGELEKLYEQLRQGEKDKGK